VARSAWSSGPRIVTGWSRELRLLRQSGAHIEPGLSRIELASAEEVVGAQFPPDLADFLRTALPVGERFPNWREPASTAIADVLAGPFSGIAFDIEQNSFWWPAWETRPPVLEDALEIARRHIASAPRLIPVYGHRYLASSPSEIGNPVFSVHQTDVIYYGRDLRSYVAHEFGRMTFREATTPEPRKIAFWSELVEANSAGGC